jgi:uncharacterized lipoprotein YehR (DUF1307 family)
MSSSFFSSRGTSRSIAPVLKLVLIAILVVGLVVAFTGCGKAGLVGKWTNPKEAGTLEFTSDGKAIFTDTETGNVELTYKVEGDKMTLSLAGMEMATVTFKVDGDTMTMDDPETGEPMTLERAK